MNTRELTLISIMSALTVAVAYGRGLALPFLPGLLDFLSIIIFVNGFCFGWFVGGAVGAISMVIYMIIPYPFAHPSAWLFMISPILLTVQGGARSYVRRCWRVFRTKLGAEKKERTRRKFIVEMALVGFILTFVYQILSSVGFYLAYPIYPSIWEAIVFTFIPRYYPYPPIAQAVTNTVIFAVLGYPLIITIKKLPLSLGVAVVDSEEGASTIAG